MSLSRSESRRIASRYVAAIFDVAQAASAHEKVGEDLQALGEAVTRSEPLQRLLVNPVIETKDKAAVFDALLQKLGAQALTTRSVRFVIVQKRIALLPDIVEAYQTQLRAFRGEREATVTTAAPLSDAMARRIADELKAAAGQQVRLIRQTEPSLIGGITIKMGSLLLDRSVAGRLQRLQATLRTAVA